MKKKTKATKAEMKKALAPFDERAEQIITAWRAILGLPDDFVFLPIQVYVCMAAATAVMDRMPPTKADITKAQASAAGAGA